MLILIIQKYPELIYRHNEGIHTEVFIHDEGKNRKVNLV